MILMECFINVFNNILGNTKIYYGYIKISIILRNISKCKSCLCIPKRSMLQAYTIYGTETCLYKLYIYADYRIQLRIYFKTINP